MPRRQRGTAGLDRQQQVMEVGQRQVPVVAGHRADADASVGRVDAGEQPCDRYARPRLRGVPARRAVQRRLHRRRARRDQFVERQIPRPVGVDDGQSPVAPPHVRNGVVQPTGDRRRGGVDGVRPGEPPLRTGQAGKPDGALQPGVQRTPATASSPARIRVRRPRSAARGRTGRATTCQASSGRSSRASAMCIHSGSTPATVSSRPVAEPIPAASVPSVRRASPTDAQRLGRRRRSPTATTRLLRGTSETTTSPTRPCADHDPRAPGRARRLCGHAGDEGERENAEQGEVGRPPRPRAGRPPGNGPHTISHQRSRRTNTTTLRLRGRRAGRPDRGRTSPRPQRASPTCRRADPARRAGTAGTPAARDVRGDGRAAGCRSGQSAAARRVAACSLSQLLIVASRSSR